MKLSSPVDWQAESKKCLAKLFTNQLDALVRDTGVPRKGWKSIGTGWADGDDLRRWKASGAGWYDDRPDGAYTIPERNGAGVIVGLALRTPDGRKGFPKGARRGLTIPSNRIDGGPTLVVEGGSDVAAGVVLGVDAIGRPSAECGADDLATLLINCEDVIILGENDGGVGLTGAESIAEKLSNGWNKPVRWSLPPDGVKDLRGLLQRLVAEGLDLADGDAVAGVREIILADLRKRMVVVEPDEDESQPDTDDEDNNKRESISTQLINMIRGDDRYELFHGNDGDDDAPSFISITDEDGGRRTVAIRSSQFKAEIGRAYYQLTGKGAAKVAIDDALATLDSMARFDGPAYPVGLRLAGHEDTIYFDLGGDDRRVVKIDRDGWTIIDSVDCQVRFHRRRGMLSVPSPIHGGDMNDLKGVLNLPDNDSWLLIAGWLIAAMNPNGPYPILVFNGEEGCGKSDGCRCIRNLIDPNNAGLRRPPRNDDDLSIAGRNSRIIAFDNLSGLRPHLSDLLCSIATGEGFGKRQLYSDNEEIIINISRPIMLNGIDEITTRGDLASRSFLLRLNPIGDEKRLDERELKAQYEKIRPGVLGAVFDALACALRNRDSVHFDRLPRMADAVKWVEAAGDALGWERGAFLGAVNRNRARMDADSIELSSIGNAILRIVDTHGGQFVGTAGQWFDELNRVDYADRPLGWPKSPKGVATAILRLAPKLRGGGWKVIHQKQGGHHGTLIEISKSENDVPDVPDTPCDSIDSGVEIAARGHRGLRGHTLPKHNSDYGELRPVKVWEVIDE